MSAFNVRNLVREIQGKFLPKPTATENGKVITYNDTNQSFEYNEYVGSASNLGISADGEGLFDSKSDVDLQFKRIKAGTNISLTSETNDVVINATGGEAVVWSDGGSFTRSSDSQFSVTDNATNQAIYVTGRPIKYRATSGTWRYGIVTAYSSGTVTIAGAPMTTSDDDEIQYGLMSQTIQLDVNIQSKFADAPNTALIASDANSALKWQLGKAYLVKISHIVKTDDSGASQPNVNVTIASSAVSTSNTNAGRAVAESWVDTVVDISIGNYDIYLGDAIEISTDAGGTNNDAENLTVSLVFILE